MAQFSKQLRIWKRHMFGDACNLRDRLQRNTLGHAMFHHAERRINVTVYSRFHTR